MTAQEHATRIAAQIDAQSIQTLIRSFAQQSAEFDKCKEVLAEKEKELVALKAEYSPEGTPAMAVGGEK